MKTTYGQEKIRTFLSRIANLGDAATLSFFESMKTKEVEIEESNRAQMFAGEYVDRTPIKPEYTPLTRKIKHTKNQPIDRVTLKDTGAFYKGINADVKPKSLEISSNEAKTPELFTKYGVNGQLLGMNEENHNKVVELCKPMASVKLFQEITRNL